jgi:hypothetical protein
MRHRLRTAVLAGAWLGLAAAASAQPSIKVCEHRNFGGKCVTLQHGVNDLRQWGISNEISSFRVYSGEWRLCTGVDFAGYCETVRGQVIDLNGTRLQDAVSSLRPVRGGGGYGGEWNDQSAISVYSQPNFTGRSWVFSNDVRDLSELGLRTYIGSVRVYGGRWQVCGQTDFRDCQAITQDIADIRAVGLNGRILSVREGGNWGGGSSGPGGRGGGRGAGGPYGPGGSAPVILFSEQEFEGPSLEVRDEIRNLTDLGFNDAAVSIRVFRGRWQICEHADFRGYCEVLSNSFGRLSPRLERQASSIRPY